MVDKLLFMAVFSQSHTAFIRTVSGLKVVSNGSAALAPDLKVYPENEVNAYLLIKFTLYIIKGLLINKIKKTYTQFFLAINYFTISIFYYKFII